MVRSVDKGIFFLKYFSLGVGVYPWKNGLSFQKSGIHTFKEAVRSCDRQIASQYSGGWAGHHNKHPKEQN